MSVTKEKGENIYCPDRQTRQGYFCPKDENRRFEDIPLKMAKGLMNCKQCPEYANPCYGPKPLNLMGEGVPDVEGKPAPAKLKVIPTELTKAQEAVTERDKVRAALQALIQTPPLRPLPGVKLAMAKKYLPEIKQAHEVGHTYGVIVDTIQEASGVKLGKNTLYTALGGRKRTEKAA